MLVNLSVTGGPSCIKRTTVQLYQSGTGQITGALGQGIGGVVQETGSWSLMRSCGSESLRKHHTIDLGGEMERSKPSC